MIHHVAAYTGASSTGRRRRRGRSSSSSNEERQMRRYTPEEMEEYREQCNYANSPSYVKAVEEMSRLIIYINDLDGLYYGALKEAHYGPKRDLSKRFVDLEERYNAINRKYGENNFIPEFYREKVLSRIPECKMAAKYIRHKFARSKLLDKVREEKGLIPMFVQAVGLKFRK